jgi:hypothetical protein
MTNALEEAIEQAQMLPEVEQDLVGELVLAYMEGDRRTYRLTPEQVAEVKLAQAEVRKGKIARDKEVQKLWESFLQA